ncbi:MAG: hypothetical protein ACFBSC_20460 [Microcoleaceae cyanobacterium]
MSTPRDTLMVLYVESRDLETIKFAQAESQDESESESQPETESPNPEKKQPTLKTRVKRLLVRLPMGLILLGAGSLVITAGAVSLLVRLMNMDEEGFEEVDSENLPTDDSSNIGIQTEIPTRIQGANPVYEESGITYDEGLTSDGSVLNASVGEPRVPGSEELEESHQPVLETEDQPLTPSQADSEESRDSGHNIDLEPSVSVNGSGNSVTNAEQASADVSSYETLAPTAPQLPKVPPPDSKPEIQTAPTQPPAEFSEARSSEPISSPSNQAVPAVSPIHPPSKVQPSAAQPSIQDSHRATPPSSPTAGEIPPANTPFLTGQTGSSTPDDNTRLI